MADTAEQSGKTGPYARAVMNGINYQVSPDSIRSFAFCAALDTCRLSAEAEENLFRHYRTDATYQRCAQIAERAAQAANL